MSRTLSDAQVVSLVGLVVEAASEHTELRTEAHHAPDDATKRRYEDGTKAAHGALRAARRALFIALGVDPTEEPF